MFYYKVIIIFVIAVIGARGMFRDEIIILINKILKLWGQLGRNLGDECIPGTCSSSNSNCKWQGSSFKCVCKEKYLQINQTHCGNSFFFY